MPNCHWRDRAFRLQLDPELAGYAVVSSGELVGHLALFDEEVIHGLVRKDAAGDPKSRWTGRGRGGSGKVTVNMLRSRWICSTRGG